jgi:hypothetical protein
LEDCFDNKADADDKGQDKKEIPPTPKVVQRMGFFGISNSMAAAHLFFLPMPCTFSRLVLY